MRKGKARAARLAATQVNTPDVCGLFRVKSPTCFFLITRLPNKFSKCYSVCRPVSPPGGVAQELQPKRAQRGAEAQHAAEVGVESPRQGGVVGQKRPPKSSLSNNGPTSPTHVKAKNTGGAGRWCPASSHLISS